MDSLEAKIADWRRTARRSCAISMSRAAGLQCRFRRSRRLRWSVVAAAFLVASCQRAGVLDPQGPIASSERLLLINSTAIMLVVVVPVIVATLAFAWWYRSSNPRASRTPGESYEGRLEFVVWSIPALTVMLLGGVIWIGSHQLDPRAPIPGKSDPLRRYSLQRSLNRVGASSVYRTVCCWITELSGSDNKVITPDNHNVDPRPTSAAR